MKIVYKPQRIPFPFDNSVVWNDPVIFCFKIPKSICDKDKQSYPYISSITVKFGDK